MDLSVIIPCHNLENYITPMLVSLNLQILEDAKVELIFICDNCTDNTEEKIRQFKFIPPYQNIIIKHCQNNSCGYSRNDGLNEAQGKIILFLDGDDWLLDPKALSTIVYIMNKKHASIIRFGFDAPPTFILKTNTSMIWQYAFKKDLIGNNRFMRWQPSEDRNFIEQIFKKIDGLENVPYFPNLILYYYNFLRPGSTMQTYFEKKQKGL